MSVARRLADPGYGFAAKLFALAVAGFALRLAYGLPLADPSGDAVFYHRVTNALADGRGFVDPFLGGSTAAHPPLFSFLLSVVSLRGGTGVSAQQVAGCALGAATPLVVGLAGRRLGGP